LLDRSHSFTDYSIFFRNTAAAAPGKPPAAKRRRVVPPAPNFQQLMRLAKDPQLNRAYGELQRRAAAQMTPPASVVRLLFD